MSEKEDLVFQALSWHAQDVRSEEEEPEDESQTHPQCLPLLIKRPSSSKYRYVIKVFGRDTENRTVSLTVTDFPPYFYIKVPDHWAGNERSFLQRFVADHLRRNPMTRGDVDSLQVRYVTKKDFWGFTNERPCKFLRLDFASLKGYRAAIKLFEAPKVKIPNLPSPGGAGHRLPLYESNMEPYIRMLHIRNLEPCGWIHVPFARLQENEIDELDTHSERDLQVSWKYLTPVSRESAAPFVVASFDIECMSDTGDFPVAKRDYRKLAFELVQAYAKFWKHGNEYDAKKRIVSCIMYAIRLIPELPQPALETFTRLPPKPCSGEAYTPQVLMTRIEMYVDEVYRILKEGFKAHTTGGPAMINHDKIATQLNALLSNKRRLNLPDLEGDSVIQIGTTFHRYGERECFYKHIVTLGSCEPFDGADVVPCESEQELLLAWKDMMTRMDPDVVIGYNIFGFDFAYMVQRAQEVGCEEAFMKVGRFKNRTCDFVKKRLSSSALGDNFLEYIDMHGRVLIDIMKVVQRDHKLDSYKLDHVASTFMKMNKNDVSPQDIFRLQRGTAADRRMIAEYCVQDCALCNHLTMKLEIIANNMGMANVCLVPLSFIFMRGQGIKIFSLVLKQCKDDGFLIPVIQRPNITILHIEFGAGIVGESDDEEHCVQTALSYFKEMIVNANSTVEPAAGGRWGKSNIPITFDEIKVFRMWKEATAALGGGKRSSLLCVVSSPQSLYDLPKRIKAYSELHASPESDWVVDAKQANTSDFSVCVEEEVIKQMPKRGIARWRCIYTYEDDDPDNADEDGDGYEGAIVLEPQEGIYIDDPISVLDYASLYPSSMISENLSHDCLVLDPRYDNLPGMEYENITYDIYAGTGDKKQKVGEKICRFVQLPDGRKGVLPTILTKLLKARKTTRKKIELKAVLLKGEQEPRAGWWDEETRVLKPADGSDPSVLTEDIVSIEDYYSPFQKAVLDGLQQAYKVTANSLYGQMGARTSPLYLKDIAACTTATGRKMILKARDFIEQNYDAQVIYGDSVTGETPVTVKYGAAGRVEMIPIAHLDRWLTRHAPSSCASWGHAHDGKEAFESPDEAFVWTDKGWTRIHRIIRHALAPHKQLFGVTTHTGYVEVTSDHSLLRSDGIVLKPCDIVVGETALLQARVRCNLEVKGEVDFPPILQTRSQLEAANWYLRAAKMGYTTWLERKEESGLFRLTFSEGKPGEEDPVSSVVTGIVELPTPSAYSEIPRFVYDLTTDNHHFAAGVGSLIVHNTDSIFVKFPNKLYDSETGEEVKKLKGKEAIMKSIESAVAASKAFKGHIKPPHDLEYEKTFWPFILLSKKRYVGNLYEFDDKKYKQKSMGIVLKRRDNAPIVKRVYGGVIDIILSKQDVNLSVQFLQDCLRELTEGKCPMDDLVISKSLRAEYKDPERIAHKVLADRMGERDPGNKPQINDRIPYVYIAPTKAQSGKEKILQGDRIEHPAYVRQNKLTPDYGFYITNQIMKPVLQLFAIVVDRIPGYKRPTDYFEELLKKSADIIGDDLKKRKDKLDQLRENEVKALLFDPFLIRIENRRQGNQEITQWFKPRAPKKTLTLDV